MVLLSFKTQVLTVRLTVNGYFVIFVSSLINDKNEIPFVFRC